MRRTIVTFVLVASLLVGATGFAAAESGSAVVCGGHNGHQANAGVAGDSETQTVRVFGPDPTETQDGVQSLVAAIADGDEDIGNGRLHVGANQNGEEQAGAGSDDAFEEDVRCTSNPDGGPEQTEQ